MKEQAIQTKLLNFLKSKGAYTVKVIEAGKAGVPDILACYKGVFLGIEVKRPETLKRVTPLQVYNLDKINEAGGLGRVVADVNTLAKILEEIDANLCIMRS